LSATPALDRPAGWVHLVRSVDGDIEVVDVGEGPHVESEAAGGVEHGGRGRHTADVELARQTGKQVGDG